MQNDLDPKGLEAAEAAWSATDMGLTWKLSDAIRAYLSATVPAGDGELVSALKGLILLKDLFDVSDRTPADAYHILATQDGSWGNARSALSAVEDASRLSQGTWVTVKALEWKPAFWNQSDPDYEHIVEIWEAFGAGNIQGWVEHQKDGKFYTEGEQFDTLDAAKAAVQAKYDRIIRSALSGDTL